MTLFHKLMKLQSLAKMIRLYLHISDVIQANKHKLHADCSLHVNFWKRNILSNSFDFGLSFSLSHLMPLVSFYTLWKQQKTYCFSGPTKIDQWHEMGVKNQLINDIQLNSPCEKILRINPTLLFNNLWLLKLISSKKVWLLRTYLV